MGCKLIYQIAGIEGYEMGDMKSISRIDKFIILVAFIFIIIFQIIIIITPPATGYEISLYNAYPPYLWLFILAALSCGLYLLVSHAFSNNSSKLWLFGYVILLYSNLLILLLPLIRGYTTLGRGDVLTHIGYIKDILSSGYFPPPGLAGANHYPIIHIIGADLSYLTGLTPELLAEIYPGLFTLFYIVSIHLLARTLSVNRGEILLITAFGSLLLFEHANLMLAPSVICFYMLPFNLFLINRNFPRYKSPEFSIVLVLVLLVIPFLHPGEGTIFLFLIILCIEISKLLYIVLNQHFSLNCIKGPTSQLLKVVKVEFILVITWCAWFVSSSVFAGTVKTILNWLMYEIGTTTATTYATTISKANLTLSEFILLLFNMYGQAVIYFIASLVLIIIFLSRVVLYKGKLSQMQSTYAVLFIVFGSLMIVALFSNAIWVEYNRVMIYVIFAATIFNGLGMYEIFRNNSRKIGTACIMLILISSATFGLFNTFPSPLVRNSNSQVTNMEVTGMEHFLDHYDKNLLIDNLGVEQQRFADCVYGRQKMLSNYGTNPPDHFGYEMNTSYGQLYTEDRYFIESKLSRISYPEIFPEYKHLWRFTPEDFYYLDNSDTSVNKIYYNGEFWTHYVRSSIA